MIQFSDLNDGTPITLRINGQDFTVMDAKVWIEAHKRIAMAEGLLSGWLALSPDDIVERLRAKRKVGPVLGSATADTNGLCTTTIYDDGYRLINPDGPEAADKIIALCARIAQLEAQIADEREDAARAAYERGYRDGYDMPGLHDDTIAEGWAQYQQDTFRSRNP